MPSKCKQGTGYEYISFGWQGKTLVEHELNLKECVGCRQVKKKKSWGCWWRKEWNDECFRENQQTFLMRWFSALNAHYNHQGALKVPLPSCSPDQLHVNCPGDWPRYFQRTAKTEDHCFKLTRKQLMRNWLGVTLEIQMSSDCGNFGYAELITLISL